MRVGLALPHYDFSYPDGRAADVAATVEWARRAEALGYESVWVSDHFFLDISRYGGPAGRHGSLEPIVTLAAIASATERVRLGTLVLCEAFRPPAMLAKQAAALDLLSHGRLELGIGAGWYEDEYVANGYDFDLPGERMARLAETLQIVGHMLERESVSFEGRHYRVDEATSRPQPSQRPRPPLWVGGKGGDRSLRIVAEHADGWNTVWRWTVEAYAERIKALEGACARVGRDPKTVRRSIGLYTIVDEDPKAIFEDWRRWAPAGMLDGTSVEQFAEGTLVGTAGECAARLRRFAELGVEEVIVAPAPLPFAIPVPEQVERIAQELIPRVRDA